MLKLIKDKFIIVKKIGTGGQAYVYEAIDRKTKQRVALKLITPEKSESIIDKTRFLSEIKVLKSIKSDYVVKLLDYHWDNEIQYIVTEYIEGKTLNELIKEKKYLEPTQAVEIGKKIALGLYDLHELNIIHRDIKSQNIIVNDFNQLKIIDLGISLHQNVSRVTKTGKIIGSPYYMSPELSYLEEASISSDIYALGILIYEMIVGKLPFIDKTPLNILKKHRFEKMPLLNKINSNIPNSLINIILISTAKNKKNRYKNAYEMFQDLNSCLEKNRINENIINFDEFKKRDWLKNILNLNYFLFFLAIVSFILATTLLVLTYA